MVMRKFCRRGVWISLVSVLALGACLLLKSGDRAARKTVRSKAREPEYGDAAADAAGRACPPYKTAAGARPGAADAGSFQEAPQSGTVLIKPEAACTVPLQVSVSGPDSYYIYLKYLKPPESDGSGDMPEPGAAGRSDISFFASAESAFLLNVPAGVYSLSYAAGREWRGLREKFGPETKYYKASGTLAFYTDGKRSYGNSLRFFPHTGGVFSPDQIEPSEFPG